MPQLGPITIWVISTTRTPDSGRLGVLMGVSRYASQRRLGSDIRLPSYLLNIILASDD